MSRTFNTQLLGGNISVQLCLSIRRHQLQERKAGTRVLQKALVSEGRLSRVSLWAGETAQQLRLLLFFHRTLSCFQDPCGVFQNQLQLCCRNVAPSSFWVMQHSHICYSLIHIHTYTYTQIKITSITQLQFTEVQESMLERRNAEAI